MPHQISQENHASVRISIQGDKDFPPPWKQMTSSKITSGNALIENQSEKYDSGKGILKNDVRDSYINSIPN